MNYNANMYEDGFDLDIRRESLNKRIEGLNKEDHDELRRFNLQMTTGQNCVGSRLEVCPERCVGGTLTCPTANDQGDCCDSTGDCPAVVSRLEICPDGPQDDESLGDPRDPNSA